MAILIIPTKKKKKKRYLELRLKINNNKQREKNPKDMQNLQSYYLIMLSRTNNTDINLNKRKWAITGNHKREENTLSSIQKEFCPQYKFYFGN